MGKAQSKNKYINMKQTRKVTFNEVPQIYYIPKYDPTRLKYWEFYVIDRLRFQHRINQFEKVFIKSNVYKNITKTKTHPLKRD